MCCFTRRFVNLSQDIAENFKCSVCLDIFEAPLELPCGHIYCFECIRTYFGSSSTSECPECRRRIESRQVKPPNRKLLCILNNLNIKCEFARCNAVVRVENLIGHTRECRFNRSTSRSSAPPSVPTQQNAENVMYLLGGDSDVIDRLERLQQLQAVIDAFAQAIEQNEEDESEVSYNDERRESLDDNEFLLHNQTRRNQLWLWIRCYWGIVFIVLIVCLYAAPIAAIVISALKLNSCTQIPTLPHSLMALGISTCLSNILETVRRRYYHDKFCIGLKFIQCFAFGSLIYLAVVVYSNLDYTIKVPSDNSPLTCDGLVFEFSFWFVSAVLILIGAGLIIWLFFAISINLYTIWSEWSGSYVKLSFIYSIAIIGMIISISTITMGSIYFDSCAAIPSLTTALLVFGTIGVVCWLTMLLSSDYKLNVIWVFVVSLLVSFIFVTVKVHQNFPWTFTSQSLHYTMNCDTTIYTYAFVIVCINYVIIGSSIFMYLIYSGIFTSICTCLFFS